jgi:RimJ/RimL family protein N-acetyltransferase
LPNTETLSTDRLLLIAATLDHLCAEIEAPAKLASMLGIDVPSGWPPGEYDRSAQEFFRDRMEELGPTGAGWYSWYVLLRKEVSPTAMLIGAAGYAGPPDGAGEIEIGYSILPAWRGQGFATEAVRALVERAFLDTNVLRIVARTTARNPASCNVLLRAGFHPAASPGEAGTLRFETLRP